MTFFSLKNFKSIECCFSINGLSPNTQTHKHNPKLEKKYQRSKKEKTFKFTQEHNEHSDETQKLRFNIKPYYIKSKTYKHVQSKVKKDFGIGLSQQTT